MNLSFFIIRSLLPAMFLLSLSACTTREMQELKPAEANRRVATAMVAKDTECNTNHQIVSPTWVKVNKNDVHSCELAIIGQSCSSWASSNGFPAVCNQLLMNRR